MDDTYYIPHTHEPTSKSALGIVESALSRDEPVFVIRAKDFFGPQVVAHYLELVEKVGPSNIEFQAEITNILNAMKSWQSSHMDQVRYPD